MASLPGNKLREYTWIDRVCSAAESLLQEILSDHFLHELIEPGTIGLESSAYAHSRIQADLENRLHHAALEVGARILRVSLGRIEIDHDLGSEISKQVIPDLEKLNKQWVAGWQARWAEREQILTGEQNSESVDLTDSEQAAAEAELVRILAEVLDAKHLGIADAKQVVIKLRAHAILDDLTQTLLANPSPAAEQVVMLWRELLA